MATLPALMTMEQYLNTSYSPDVHFVLGETEERNVGEKDHARLQNMIGAWFVAREAVFDTDTTTELRILVSPDRVRVCDVAVLDAYTPDEQVATAPPLVCVEVMSPEDRLSRAIRVLEDYRAMGVENIWLVDPQERLAYTFGSGGLKQQQDLVLSVPGTEIGMDVAALFLELDRKKSRGA